MDYEKEHKQHLASLMRSYFEMMLIFFQFQSLAYALWCVGAVAIRPVVWDLHDFVAHVCVGEKRRRGSGLRFIKHSSL